MCSTAVLCPAILIISILPSTGKHDSMLPYCICSYQQLLDSTAISWTEVSHCHHIIFTFRLTANNI